MSFGGFFLLFQMVTTWMVIVNPYQLFLRNMDSGPHSHETRAWVMTACVGPHHCSLGNFAQVAAVSTHVLYLLPDSGSRQGAQRSW